MATMNLEALVARIMATPELQAQPPVLIDVGASGNLHRPWATFAANSIAVVFDADDREFAHVEKADSRFRKLHVFNRIVAPKAQGKMPFYLTKSPFCSSALKPVPEYARAWSFAPLFELDREIQLETIDLETVLRDLGLTYLDWFKCDSQGTDLRLFLSLPDAVKETVLALELEPGIHPFYAQEDSLGAVLTSVVPRGFWLADLEIEGVPRLERAIWAKYLPEAQVETLEKYLRRTPGWGEMCFLRDIRLSGEASRTKRSLMLGWLFASLYAQHGEALFVAVQGQELFPNEPLFKDLTTASVEQMRDDFRTHLRRKVSRRVRGYFNALKALIRR